ncbi:CRISPR-associated endonuclease Cas2 [Rhizobium deserti]|uniref:CRISPR-associated endoribonuclease Cas2 n=1 Tax=Rhizobium deserti TaxID=2547961 RepID=A0A4R5U6F2_9HYPH|nr:CRISPR-associated endonuclease Cas2 [Rhizobium deserti]TDK29830.1 CRISPR-associated endonuclease Cas2 [Rhizobium deserti]
MPRDTPLRVLCYDISNDAARRRVAVILEDNASRVQFSVFETRLNNAQLKRLIERIEPILAMGDSLRVYTIHTTGEKHYAVHGHGAPIETDANYWLLERKTEDSASDHHKARAICRKSSKGFMIRFSRRSHVKWALLLQIPFYFSER